uniref:Uncharacterized protein n=1 Tax=Pyramimonas obovata TaxID=1411642 RepID=A0A7S0WF13_9CHLO
MLVVLTEGHSSTGLLTLDDAEFPRQLSCKGLDLRATLWAVEPHALRLEHPHRPLQSQSLVCLLSLCGLYQSLLGDLYLLHLFLEACLQCQKRLHLLFDSRIAVCQTLCLQFANDIPLRFNICFYSSQLSGAWRDGTTHRRAPLVLAVIFLCLVRIFDFVAPQRSCECRDLLLQICGVLQSDRGRVY